MPQTRASRPGRPLDDDWLFCDPMLLELDDVQAAGPPPAYRAAGCPRCAPRRSSWLACTLLAAGIAAGAMAWAAWEARLTLSAIACAHGHASREEASPQLPGKELRTLSTSPSWTRAQDGERGACAHSRS